MFAEDDWDFQDVLSDLLETAEAALENEVKKPPKKLRMRAEDIASNGPSYWIEDESLFEENWSTDGMAGGYWSAFFHADPAGFAAKVKREAIELTLQLNGYRPGVG